MAQAFEPPAMPANAHQVVRAPGAVTGIKQSRLSKATRDRILQIGSPLGLLALWEVIVLAGMVNSRFLPAPTQIIGSFWNLASTGLLYLDLKASLYRILMGFVIGVVPGMVIGLSMGLFPIVRTIFDPVVSATYPIPKLALLPLFMLIFGLGNLEIFFTWMLT